MDGWWSGPVRPRAPSCRLQTLSLPQRDRERERERESDLSLSSGPLVWSSDGITRNLTRAANRFIITARAERVSEGEIGCEMEMAVACGKGEREA